MVAPSQRVGSLHVRCLGELFQGGGMKFNDFAMASLKKFLLFLLPADHKARQEGGREVDTSVTPTSTRGLTLRRQ